MSKADAFDQTGKIAVKQNIQGTLDFLRKSPPFNLMEAAHLSFMVENCKLRFYAAGDSIIKPEDGPAADGARIVADRLPAGVERCGLYVLLMLVNRSTSPRQRVCPA